MTSWYQSILDSGSDPPIGSYPRWGATESAHLAMTSKDKRNKRKKTTKAAVPDQQKKHKKDENPNGCYFCGS